MKTLELDYDQMQCRIARYEKLEPMHSELLEGLPQEAVDMIIARRICPVIVPPGLDEGPFANKQMAPISQQDLDYSMSIAICPPGTGPGLHAHHKTTETFTCLAGKFRFQWGINGEYETVMDRFDTVSVPPGVCRRFEAAGPEDGILQVIVSGGISDMNDIELPASSEEKLRRISPECLEKARQMGLTFNAY